MTVTLDYKGDKGLRMLDIFERLNKGEQLSKRDLANYYGVGEKTIQRDIDDIRSYLADKHGYEPDVTVKYNRSQNYYYLARFEREWLSNQEVLAVCKILLESRAFIKEEMEQLLTKLLVQATPTQRKVVEDIIKSESVNYVPLQHKKPLVDILWQVSDAIIQEHPIKFSYTRQDGRTKERTAKPLAVIFSEFYFYLTQTSHTENIPYALINQLELNVESHSRTLLCTQTTHPKSGQIVQESFQERFDQQDF